MMIKKLVDGLHLEKFYDDFKRDDNSYNYIVELYAYQLADVIYIGNRQIPSDIGHDYTREKYDMAEYWMNGNCSIFTVLYRYENTSNSLYDPDTHTGNKLANQKLLNTIKKLIIDTCNTNFNIQILPENYDIVEQIGKQIYEWKHNIASSIASYTIDEMRNDFIDILRAIDHDFFHWHKFLIMKNRFWYISLEDDTERQVIGFDKFTKKQQALFIVMKEWLAMVVNESALNQGYSMHIDKLIIKLSNTRFKNVKMFESSKSKFFHHKTAIKLVLSLMYYSSTQKQIEDTYVSFRKWRANYNKIIFK